METSKTYSNIQKPCDRLVKTISAQIWGFVLKLYNVVLKANVCYTDQNKFIPTIMF